MQTRTFHFLDRAERFAERLWNGAGGWGALEFVRIEQREMYVAPWKQVGS